MRDFCDGAHDAICYLVSGGKDASGANAAVKDIPPQHPACPRVYEYGFHVQVVAQNCCAAGQYELYVRGCRQRLMCESASKADPSAAWHQVLDFARKFVSSVEPSSAPILTPPYSKNSNDNSISCPPKGKGQPSKPIHSNRFAFDAADCPANRGGRAYDVISGRFEHRSVVFGDEPFVFDNQYAGSSHVNPPGGLAGKTAAI